MTMKLSKQSLSLGPKPSTLNDLQVNDNIIVAAEGEMADFQEMQTILSDMVQEQEELRDYLDVCDVRPQQAQHFMSQVIYSLKPKPSTTHNMFQIINQEA